MRAKTTKFEGCVGAVANSNCMVIAWPWGNIFKVK